MSFLIYSITSNTLCRCGCCAFGGVFVRPKWITLQCNLHVISLRDFQVTRRRSLLSMLDANDTSSRKKKKNSLNSFIVSKIYNYMEACGRSCGWKLFSSSVAPRHKRQVHCFRLGDRFVAWLLLAALRTKMSCSFSSNTFIHPSRRRYDRLH